MLRLVDVRYKYDPNSKESIDPEEDGRLSSYRIQVKGRDFQPGVSGMLCVSYARLIWYLQRILDHEGQKDVLVGLNLEWRYEIRLRHGVRGSRDLPMSILHHTKGGWRNKQASCWKLFHSATETEAIPDAYLPMSDNNQITLVLDFIVSVPLLFHAL